MYVTNGKVRYGTPLHRLETAIAGQTALAVVVLAGDLDDVCNTLDPKDKLVAALKKRVEPQISEGNVTAQTKVKVEEIKQLIAACIDDAPGPVNAPDKSDAPDLAEDPSPAGEEPGTTPSAESNVTTAPPAPKARRGRKRQG